MSMNTPGQVPPRQSGGGCCGMGCAAMFMLVGFFMIALIAGTLWAVYHFRETYSADKPLEFPEAIAPDIEGALEAQPAEMPTGSSTPVPAAQVEVLQDRWEDFEKASDRNQKGRIELTAGDINALIQADPDLRGKVFVSIENNIGLVRLSIPLEKIVMMDGRYLNAEVTVQASPDGNPAGAQISHVIIGSESMPDGVLDQSLFGLASVRSLISDWLAEQQIETFRIENNRVIGETTGQ